MIKFFRQIRLDLMENKTRKPVWPAGRYLKYAIGEIILVVIGILIALQINNWNENRIKHSKETASLLGIKSELIETLYELNSDFKSVEYGYESTIDVHSYIINKPVEIDSMYEDFYRIISFNYFFPKTSNYETLKSGSLNNIQSDSMRELITDIYEAGYQRILSKENTRRNAAKVLFPYYQKHFRAKILNITDEETGKKTTITIAIPINYDHLINDSEFETLIVEAIKGRSSFLSDYSRTINKVEACIRLIEDYLKDKTN